MVDAREQLEAMRVERLAQPCLDLFGTAAGGQHDHVRTLSGRSRSSRPPARRTSSDGAQSDEWLRVRSGACSLFGEKRPGSYVMSLDRYRSNLPRVGGVVAVG